MPDGSFQEKNFVENEGEPERIQIPLRRQASLAPGLVFINYACGPNPS